MDFPNYQPETQDEEMQAYKNPLQSTTNFSSDYNHQGHFFGSLDNAYTLNPRREELENEVTPYYHEYPYYSNTNQPLDYSVKNDRLSPSHSDDTSEASFSERYIPPSYLEELPYDNYPNDDEPLDLSTNRLEEYEREDDIYPTSSDAASSMAGGDSFESGISWLQKIRTGTRSRVRSPKSWEFLLRLLLDPASNPSMIRWENKEEGTFRLVMKDEIARIWGTRTTKHKDVGLTYDNFARNLRYHYKTKMMVPVSERHLVYQFGSKIMENLRNGEIML